MNPLAGITVVALAQAVAAPFATRQLAGLGARLECAIIQNLGPRRGRRHVAREPARLVELVRPPVTVEGCEPVMAGVPALGAHNESIREESR